MFNTQIVIKNEIKIDEKSIKTKDKDKKKKKIKT